MLVNNLDCLRGLTERVWLCMYMENGLTWTNLKGRFSIGEGAAIARTGGTVETKKQMMRQVLPSPKGLVRIFCLRTVSAYLEGSSQHHLIREHIVEIHL